MKQDTLVSVIIPAYNAQPYIEKCVDSILASTYKNIEVIVVDDGSSDSTVSICRSINDSRLTVIEAQHGGVSNARNIGIKNSGGGYLLFVDSDDWVSKDIISHLVSITEEYKSDVTIGNYSFVYNDHSVLAADTQTDIVEFRGDKTKDYLRMFMLKGYAEYKPYPALGQPIGTLYSAELIKQNGIQFPVGLQYKEDVIFNLYAGYYSHSVVWVNKSLYFYNKQNESSLTSGGDKGNKLSHILEDFKYRNEFAEKFMKDDLLFKRGLQQYMIKTFCKIIVPSCIKSNDFAECKKIYQLSYVKNAFDVESIGELSSTEKGMFWMCKFSLHLYYGIMKVVFTGK